MDDSKCIFRGVELERRREQLHFGIELGRIPPNSPTIRVPEILSGFNEKVDSSSGQRGVSPIEIPLC